MIDIIHHPAEPSTDPGTDSVLNLLAAGGLSATVVFEGPATACPHCRTVMAPAA